MRDRFVFFWLVVVVFVNLIFRFFNWVIQPDVFKDSSGLAYPLGFDSYSFLYNAKVCVGGDLFVKVLCVIYHSFGYGFVFLVVPFFLVLSLLIFFKLCQLFVKSDSICLFSTLLFGFATSFVTQSRVGSVDNGVLVMFFVLVIVFCLIKVFQSLSEKSSFFYLIVLFVASCFFVISYSALEFKLSFLFSKVFVDLDVNSVSEMAHLHLASPWYNFFVVAFFVGVGVWYFFIVRRWDFRFVVVLGLLFFALGCWRVRFFYLCLPFVYVVFGVFCEGLSNKRDKLWLWGVVIIMVSVTPLVVMDSVKAVPPVDDALVEASDYVNSLEKDCVVSFWGQGSLWRFYLNKSMSFHSHPYRLREQYDFFVYGNRSLLVPYNEDCIVVLSSKDLGSLNYLTFFYDDSVDERDFFIVRRLGNATLFENDVSRIWVWE